MLQSALLPESQPPLPPDETTFTPSFYAPYEAAALAALAMLSDARARLGETDGVRAVTYRLKTPASIRGKLKRRGLPATPECAATLHDIAGLRFVLESEAQVYRFERLILASPAAELLQKRDYIASPKPSGYRSLHLIVRMCTPDARGGLPVEIQLRTAPMDLWARVEHDACYKPAPQSVLSTPI